MTETTTQPGTVITNPQMDGAYYGIAVCSVGEDGDAIALGHHDDRRALAAFNAHARRHLGLVNVADDPRADAQDWLDAIRQEWVVFRTPDPEQGEDPEWIWYAEDSSETNPHARPVTFLAIA
ncbi:hypothetical protein [Streptomyces cinereoruber]|uniref:hypothetical protein n=1 Tax=Streptomyces cinereoruber TaxID=67260 RepID=UPI0036276BB3